MSQRFCLFYAGYSASAPSVYYNETVLLRNYLPEYNTNGQLDYLSEHVHNLSYEAESCLKTAISVAKYFKLDVMSQPASPEEYVAWLKDYMDAFEEQFPLTRIEHYYFFYARKIAEMLSHIGMVTTLSDLALCLNLQENILKQIDTHLSEIEILIFRNKAATALLSSEPRHSYFMALYNEINTGFEKFRSVKPLTLTKDELDELKESIDDFRVLILNGFKRCIVLLKDLSI